MTKIRQEYQEEKGIRRAVCPLCNQVIKYPEGVYFRRGIEIHSSCVSVARMRRGEIAGVDYNINK